MWILDSKNERNQNLWNKKRNNSFEKLKARLPNVQITKADCTFFCAVSVLVIYLLFTYKLALRGKFTAVCSGKRTTIKANICYACTDKFQYRLILSAYFYKEQSEQGK